EIKANSLIQRLIIKDFRQFQKDGGMDRVVPRVALKKVETMEVNLKVSEKTLIKIGKEGIVGVEGPRGPLALDLPSMKAIKKYFKTQKRNPTDVELESLAQTWSEHCKHTIFAGSIDQLKEGLFKGLIKRATQEIRKKKGKGDFCVSVFTDNAGGILFDKDWVVTDKAETHNTPCTLDPFGGAITGIVGVNRDCLGFGKGAKPVINRYGFCLADPRKKNDLYRGKNRTNPALSPRKVMDGVVDGVHAGGNQSGIPTPQGFLCFDDRYRGKPLIFVGTVGLIPKLINGKPGWEKGARAGDKIVVIGGRVGQDGIHGATFSSEALHEGSPATAVQIGDPITQKKLSDAIVKEARDRDLYNSITDNGAGGISCSVAEMAKECGGCEVELDRVPLKYPNLEPWKIWISESQERMTLAVPPEKTDEFISLMNRRGVEATVIGTFTNSGRCVVRYDGKTVMDIYLQFLHEGVPIKKLKTVTKKHRHPEPQFPCPKNLGPTLLEMLERPNVAGFEFLSMQYDHEVQAGSVIKPLQGKGRVNGEAAVTRPVLSSIRAVVTSQGLHPRYSDIDTYPMAACSIDTAVRNAVSVGADPDYMAIMDNFCWCSSNEPERLGELKAAVQACYDTAKIYGTPFISGKDSMFNDFKGYDAKGNPIKVSVPPTLLISGLGVIPDAQKTQTLDVKVPGDLIYVLGSTRPELGGSEYWAMRGFTGNSVPQVNAKRALELYRKVFQVMQHDLLASCISVNVGGLGVALAKMAIAGELGLEVDLTKVSCENVERKDHLLFSETQSRFVMTIDPKNQKKFETHFGNSARLIGTVTKKPRLKISDVVDVDVATLAEAYKKLFKNF
ncbi:MAG: AIR synthase-related protein, partial [Candidatus Peregrinibacteria bacterium]